MMMEHTKAATTTTTMASKVAEGDRRETDLQYM